MKIGKLMMMTGILKSNFENNKKNPTKLEISRIWWELIIT